MDPEMESGALDETLARRAVGDSVLGLSQTIARVPGVSGDAGPLPTISLAVRNRGTGSVETELGDAADLICNEELGRGGMGVVHLAEQRSLKRSVAVKTVLSSDATGARGLVREAQILGALEHPNVVPVHALGLDDLGRPVLVMKRIEGASWRTLLLDSSHPSWGPLLAGHGDPLRANVEILVQLCRALAFAHDRGVVHRDLKPENVMIGRYGEVYLVDWGVALRLSERELEAATIVGTPAYLAPEMARADARLVDARTDVYLLGGVLFEVLTGRVPHEAPTALAALVLALRGEPPVFPEGTPHELAELARKAMARDPDSRVASAESFREGLVHFLASRDVDRAAAEARLARSRGRDLMASAGPASLEAFRALVEARITFVAAHRVRPLDERLRQDLDETLALLVEREIALRSPVGARAVLSEMKTLAPSLNSRVDALEAELAAERLAAAAHVRTSAERDLSPAFRSRAVWALMAVALGLLSWTVFAQPASLGSLRTMSVGVLATALAAFAWQRRVLLATPVLRRQAAFILLLSALPLLVDTVLRPRGASASEVATMVFATHAIVWAVRAMMVRHVWLNGLVFLLALGGALAWPVAAIPLSVPAGFLMFAVWTRAARLNALERAAQVFGR